MTYTFGVTRARNRNTTTDDDDARVHLYVNHDSTSTPDTLVVRDGTRALRFICLHVGTIATDLVFIRRVVFGHGTFESVRKNAQPLTRPFVEHTQCKNTGTRVARHKRQRSVYVVCS